MLNYRFVKENILESKNNDDINIQKFTNIDSLSDNIKDKTGSQQNINNDDNLINDTIQFNKGGENINNNKQDNKIIVETDISNSSFTFYDSNKNLLGSFNIKEFIKVITSNVTNNFLITVDGKTAKPLIERYICNVSFTENTNNYSVNMLNWIDSPFMGDINILVKLYLFINNFERKELKYELAKLNEQERIIVIDIFNELIYNIVSHILKVISMISSKLSDNPKVRHTLLQYSISLVHRLSRIIKKELVNKNNNIEILKQNLINITNEKKNINERLIKLENSKNNNITNSSTNDSLITSDNNTQTITDESEIYDINTDGGYTKYKNTESVNNNLTLSELVEAVDKVRTSNVSINSNIPSNNVATSLMDIISLNNSISNMSSDNFFHSEGIGVGGAINYLSSN